MAKDYLTSTEGTQLKDLVKMRPGITGVFMTRHYESEDLMRQAHSYAHRAKSKVETRKAPIILDKDDVWYVVFITVVE